MVGFSQSNSSRNVLSKRKLAQLAPSVVRCVKWASVLEAMRGVRYLRYRFLYRICARSTYILAWFWNKSLVTINKDVNVDKLILIRNAKLNDWLDHV